MKKISQYTGFFLLIVGASFMGCKKQDDFLNASPRSSLAIPSTLKDLELMCMSEYDFNAGDPSFPNISSEPFFLSDVYYNSQIPQLQAGYAWAKDMQFNQTFSMLDWDRAYSQVLIANTILEALDRIKYNDSERGRANAIKGMALFYRSWAFFNLAREFAMPYDSSIAESQLGIPIRLSSALEIKSSRASLKDTYDRIVNDFKEAASLLPANSVNISTPNRLAARGALARVFLSVGDYKDALEVSNSFLEEFSTLTDFNTLSPLSSVINSDLLSEDVYHIVMIGYALTSAGTSQTQVDSSFFASYDSNDVRKTVYFRVNPAGRRYFRGSYDMLGYGLYSGIATDEMLLTRAECNARLGKPQTALDDLNRLLRYRYKTGTFQDYTLATSGEVVSLILKEREKELYMRGQRWNDLRRLNREPGRAVTLKRIINGTVYTLPPNDPRYAIQIPEQEILLSGIQQNAR